MISLPEKVKTVTPSVVLQEAEEVSAEKELDIQEHSLTVKATNGRTMPGDSGIYNDVVSEQPNIVPYCISRLPLYDGKAAFIQPKLIISKPGDIYEQEADAVADKIMTMTETDASIPDIQTPPSAFSSAQSDNAAETPAKNSLETDGSEEEQDQETQLPSISMLHQFSSGDDDPFISRKEQTDGNISEDAVVMRPLLSSGRPLDKRLREKMEKRFGFDFSNVRIHTDNEAYASARSINAAAFTVRNNIVFGKGFYQPHTSDGQRLLAHELTHVIQQSGLYSGAKPAKANSGIPVLQLVQKEMIQREEELNDKDKEILQNPVIGTATANIYKGIEFTPQDPKQIFREGSHKYIQAISGLIKSLAGTLYKPELVTGYIQYLGGEANIAHYGGAGVIAGANEKFTGYTLLDSLPGLLIQYFDENNIPVAKEIRDVIQAYYDVNRLLEMLQLSTPKWFTRPLLAFLVTSKKTWLTKFAELAAREDRGESDPKEYSGDYYEKLETYVYYYIDIIEAIRRDNALVGEPVYAMLWDLPFNNPDAKIKVASPKAAGDHINLENALRLIQQCNTDIKDAKKATAETDEGHNARLKLLKDAMSIPINGKTAKANTQLSDRLNRFNAPAFPATLRSYPPLEPPLFELVSGTTPTFSMSVEFGDFYDALGFAFAGTYGFELIRVDDSLIENLIKIKEGNISDDTNAKAREEMKGVSKIGEDQSVRGETPNVTDVIGQKVSRRMDYLEEDVDTVFKGVHSKIGVAEGMGILTLDAVGNAFGVLGDVIYSFWETISGDRWEKQIPINKPGLYIVRATAYQRDIPEDAVYVHAPSVAWMPVWARSAADYSSKYLDYVMAGREAAESQLKDLNMKIFAGFLLPKEERDKLIRKRNILRGLLSSSAIDQLEAKKMTIEDALASNPDEETKQLLEKQKTELERLIGIQQTRALENKSDEKGLEAPFTLPAVFVSDKGPTSRLTIEMIQKYDAGGQYQYYVSDLTSSKKGGEEGPLMNNREDAITEALKQYMGRPDRYGRGYCTISIPPVAGSKADAIKKTIRITADGDAIVMESIDNITTAMAAILIAAAPFTEGASLALLLPLGVIGAIPSAYRLYDRYDSGSFYLDWDTAMDIVNVLSSFVGVAGKVAGGLKLVTVGKGFVIIGFGLDGLGFIAGGAMTLEEIDAISKRQDLSPGAKRAMIMSAIGGQLANLGLAIGSRVYEAGQLMEKTAAQEGNTGSQKPPLQENIPPGGQRDVPVKITDADVQKPPVVSNEPQIKTPDTTAPDAPDNIAKQPAVNTEPDLQAPPPQGPVVPVPNEPLPNGDAQTKKPVTPDMTDAEAPDTKGPIVPEPPVPDTGADAPAKQPITPNEPEIKAPATKEPVIPDSPAPDVESDVPLKQPAEPDEPAMKSPDETKPNESDKEQPAENEPLKQSPEETGTQPIAEEAEPKKPVDESEGTASQEGDATPPVPESPIDKKIAAAEAALAKVTAEKSDVLKKRAENQKKLKELHEKRLELSKRRTNAKSPEEKLAAEKDWEEAKQEHERLVEEFEDLKADYNNLQGDESKLTKAVKDLKDIKSERLPEDINVDPKAPPGNDGKSTIGTTPNQEAQLRADIAAAKKAGAVDIRVNQQQVDINDTRVGNNRPDLQYTLNGKRYYIEYEHPNNPRGDDHTRRILANDPNGIVEVKLVPNTPNFTPGKGVVTLTKP